MDAPSRTLALPAAAPPGIPIKILATHLWRNGYLPDLADPKTFNELVQLRKLRDRDPMLPLLADKVKVKTFVERRLGSEWTVPTLWYGKNLPERPNWPIPFVLKSSHASCQCIFVHEERSDWPRLTAKAEHWLKRQYGTWLDEWLYRHIEPQLLVEPFIGNGRDLPIDYKFFVFGGRARFIQVDTDRGHAHKRVMFDREWRRLPMELQFPIDPRPIAAPRSLASMIEAAETLARGFDFVRVDFYEVAERPLFGEMTFYPGSGLDRFRPVFFDRLFGECWNEARQSNVR